MFTSPGWCHNMAKDNVHQSGHLFLKYCGVLGFIGNTLIVYLAPQVSLPLLGFPAVDQPLLFPCLIAEKQFWRLSKLLFL